MKKPANQKPTFDSQGVYSTAQVAAMFGKSTKHIREKWIKTGKIRYVPDGNVELILGQWIVDMCSEQGVFFEEQAPSNRGKHNSKKKNN